jgi:hypothetical protein
MLSLVLACGDDTGIGSGSLSGTTTFTTTAADSSTSGTTGGDDSSGGMSASADSSTSAAADSSSSGADSSSDGGSSDTGIDACDMVDEPDAAGLDENGDGIDGVLCRAVFVSASVGSDLNDGLMPDDPVATIARGIEIAQTYNPPRMVLVAEANYLETVNVDSGVSLYGGYDAVDWSRDTALNITTISATEDRALIAQNLELAVEVDGFTINASDYTDGGVTSYGVWVRDTPEGLFTLDYCIVNAGSGGAGDDGATGDAGGDGEDGDDAAGSGGAGGGASACNATGGAGDTGAGQCIENVQTSGEAGSAGGDTTTVGNGGPSGADRCGSNIISDCDDSGGNGTVGGNGFAGVNGAGGDTTNANQGSFGGDGVWSPPGGTDATRGRHGGGGGGGGSGGIDEDPFTCGGADLNGGGGGGGGSGGCGGDPGQTGQAGGGSFAMVVINSSITIRNVDLNLATGGSGGDGGDGGNGGTPGGGGTGWTTNNEAGEGANGGNGGGGGGGGGGAGGCGGASVGIATVGNAEVGITNVSFNGGNGGTGGAPGEGGIRADGLNLQAPAGEDGCDGFRADQHAY